MGCDEYLIPHLYMLPSQSKSFLFSFFQVNQRFKVLELRNYMDISALFFFIGRYVWLPFFYASKVFFYLIKSPLKFVPQKIKNKIKKRSSLKSLSCESVHTFYMDISASIFFLYEYFGFIIQHEITWIFRLYFFIGCHVWLPIFDASKVFFYLKSLLKSLLLKPKKK